AGEGDVAFRHFHQRLGERLDQQVIDAELYAARLKPGVELAAKLQQRIELDIDGEVDVRDLLLRLGQAARNGLADVGKFGFLVRDRLLHGSGHDEMTAANHWSWGSRARRGGSSRR